MGEWVRIAGCWGNTGLFITSWLHLRVWNVAGSECQYRIYARDTVLHESEIIADLESAKRAAEQAARAMLTEALAALDETGKESE